MLPVKVALTRQGEEPVVLNYTLQPGDDKEVSVHSELGFEPIYFRAEVCADGAFSAALTQRKLSDLMNNTGAPPHEVGKTVIR